MGLSATIRTPLEHPSYVGHFPGRPIVPGVLLLELVAQAIGRGAPTLIDGVKFHRALSPGESFELSIDESAERVRFRCLLDAAPVAEGVFGFGARG